MKSTLYRRHTIWRRIGSNRAARYVCFESLSDPVFTVQSCDFHDLPVDRETLRQHEDQAVELFIETDPQERNGSFPSLVDAIQAWDLDFENDQDVA
ncbi:MAG: hypothetical protein P4L64_18015 [Caulobacteraceae bacterium]|nr:hypothetical protein [Caulobacteraceae bacterium]